MRLRSNRYLRAMAMVLSAAVVFAATGCGKQKIVTLRAERGKEVVPGLKKPIDLPTVDSKPGTAVMILVDTSGSMGQSVRDANGKERPKYQIAREALEAIVRHTAEWKKKHPDRALQVGLCNFNSSVGVVMPMSDFNEAELGAALGRLPRPNSGTAIGTALERGAQELYRSGCIRKQIVCITDGENTSGVRPDVIARQLFAQTEGGLGFNFVAFDTSAKQFNFVDNVKGYVTHAADGAQLQTELTKIYDQRILAEKEDPPT